jgi:hypothetical protein
MRPQGRPCREDHRNPRLSRWNNTYNPLILQLLMLRIQLGIPSPRGQGTFVQTGPAR